MSLLDTLTDPLGIRYIKGKTREVEAIGRDLKTVTKKGAKTNAS